jgi:hypothetical protein
VLFALLRSVLWASVQPGWFAPDEDYHWLYINYLVEKHTVPRLDQPFYTGEIFKAVTLSHQGQYVLGPRTVYKGDPHAVLSQIGGPKSEREPAPPDPRPVLHPPGYYLGGALVDWALWNKVSITRLTAIRYYSALLGAITIFFAWLLAAQVLAREWQRLAAAALAATQPILAFSASTITNDVAVAAVITATLAWCAWMLRGPPSGRQGIGLGLLLSAAVLIKATTLSLVLVIGVTLWFSWRLWPEARRRLRTTVAWTVGLPVLLAGWWYLRLLVVTGSLLGEKGSLTSGGTHGPGLLHAPSIAWRWISGVYRSYWFDYNSFEVRHQDLWFWLPAVGIVLVALGFVLLVRRTWRTWKRPESPELRQVALLTFTALLLLGPPLALDTLRGVSGLSFTTQQGRFLTPAYPALAVIAVIAMRELVARRERLYRYLVAALVAGSFILYCHTWIVWVLERFYGPINGHFVRALFHASFDKPNFVTQWSLLALVIAAAVSFVGAYALTFLVPRPPPESAQEGADGPPVERQRSAYLPLGSGQPEVG